MECTYNVPDLRDAQTACESLFVAFLWALHEHLTLLDMGVPGPSVLRLQGLISIPFYCSTQILRLNYNTGSPSFQFADGSQTFRLP